MPILHRMATFRSSQSQTPQRPMQMPRKSQRVAPKNASTRFSLCHQQDRPMMPVASNQRTTENYRAIRRWANHDSINSNNHA